MRTKRELLNNFMGRQLRFIEHVLREGGIVMIDRVPSTNACRHLRQLEVHKLLQCGDQVVCPKGLNGELEPIQFIFSEPSVYNTDALNEPTHEPSLLQVNLSSITLVPHILNATLLHTSQHKVSL